ncbi:MAG: hypothetical protein JWQ46_1287 [Phenylobacterium sp.]|nr:hypothetical protein [Phenylobacterium sp.]
MTRWVYGLGVCLALFTAEAAAQPGDHGGERMRGPRNLYVSPCGQPFRATESEPYPVAAWFAKTDLNADGVLDRSEFRAEATEFFHVLDQNQDGIISGPEITRYEQAIVPEIVRGVQVGANDAPARLFLAQMGGGMGGMGGGGMGGGGMGGGGGGGGGGRGHNQDDGAPAGPRGPAAGGRSMEGAAPYTLLAEPEPVSGSDMDLDGRITLAEFLSSADRRFRRLDTDGDGKLTLATLPHTLQQKMTERRRGAASGPA